jgi:hypothetical protein
MVVLAVLMSVVLLGLWGGLAVGSGALAIRVGGRRGLGVVFLLAAVGMGLVPASAGGETTCPGFLGRWFTNTDPGCGGSFYVATLPIALAMLVAGTVLLLRRPTRSPRAVVTKSRVAS